MGRAKILYKVIGNHPNDKARELRYLGAVCLINGHHYKATRSSHVFFLCRKLWKLKYVERKDS